MIAIHFKKFGFNRRKFVERIENSSLFQMNNLGENKT